MKKLEKERYEKKMDFIYDGYYIYDNILNQELNSDDVLNRLNSYHITNISHCKEINRLLLELQKSKKRG